MTRQAPPAADRDDAGRDPAGSGDGSRSGWPDLVARFTAGRIRLLTVVWIVLLLLGALGGATLADSLNSQGWDVPGSGTVAVRDELAAGLAGRGATDVLLVIHDKQQTVDSPAFEQRAREVFETTVADARLQVSGSFGWNTLSPLNRGKFVGADRRTVTTAIGIGLGNDEATKKVPVVQEDLGARFEGQGLDVAILSVQGMQGEANKLAAEGLIRSELLAFPLIVIVLLLLFRSVLAMVAAMAVTITGIAVTLGIIGVLAARTELSIFVENIVLMLGLGVGVDYSLVMIKRFKEELAAGNDVHASVLRTLRTGGRTVATSGLTIIVAALPLFIVRMNTIVSLAVGAVVVVAVTTVTSLLLLPVLLHVLGPRINAGKIPIPARFRTDESADETRLASHRWYRLAATVMRHRFAFLGAGIAVLVLLAIPAADMKLSLPGPEILPSSSAIGRGFDRVATQYGPGVAAPIQVVVRTDAAVTDPAVGTELNELVADLSALPDVAAVNSALTVTQQISPELRWQALDPAAFDRLPADAQQGLRYYVSGDRQKSVIEVISTRPFADEATITLLERVRARTDALPATLHADVGGNTARAVDPNHEIERNLPWVIVLMLIALYVVLLISFRSIFLPLKAILMNGLAVGATFGVLVAIFQKGWLPQVPGLDQPGYLLSFAPILVLALMVGLSTDYEVFLLNRVRERYLQTRDNHEAVAVGIARTAPLITGAAVLMIAVFGAFGFGGFLPIEQIGIGLAIAVALDVTVIRSMIVPAAMSLMGRWNWWPGDKT
ncbi:MMPL family transporter [Nocardia brasiliensis]